MRTIYDLHKWLLARWERANFWPWWPGRVLLLVLSPLIHWHQGWMEREKARRAEHSAKRFAVRTRHWQRSRNEGTGNAAETTALNVRPTGQGGADGA